MSRELGLRMRATFGFLLVSIIPLVFALRWAVMQCPIAKEDYVVEASWIDDRYAVLHYDFEYGHRWNTRHRVYLLDCSTQNKKEIVGGVSRKRTLHSEVPIIATMDPS